MQWRNRQEGAGLAFILWEGQRIFFPFLGEGQQFRFWESDGQQTQGQLQEV